MVVTSGQWPSIVQRDLSIIFVDQYRGYPSMLPLIYRNKMAEQGTEYLLEAGDVGNPVAFNGSVYYDSVSEGWKKSVQETMYTLGLAVSRPLLRNDLYGAVRDSVGLIAQAFRHLRESQGAFPFVNAFNASFTTGDGLSLCNSAHTNNNLNGAGSFSNTNSLAFSAPNVQANRVSMKKLTSNRGNPIINVPDTLMVPLDLEDTAFEILQSMGKVDTANNNRNYSEGRYRLLVWENYLTSATNWFLVNSLRMKNELVWFDWEKTSFYRSGEFDTLVTKFMGLTSFGIGLAQARSIFGSSN